MADITKNAPAQEVETSPEDTKQLMRGHEDDILAGLLTAAGFKTDEDEVHPVEIIRDGKLLFTFRIHPLSEEDYKRCRDKHTKYVRNKQLGIRLPENTDTTSYRSAIIYEATVKEDQEKVWGNKAAWKALDIVTPTDLIDLTLKAGEKDAVLDLIDSISGYSMTAEEVAKN